MWTFVCRDLVRIHLSVRDDICNVFESIYASVFNMQAGGQRPAGDDVGVRAERHDLLSSGHGQSAGRQPMLVHRRRRPNRLG